jgi:hypothetical protein
MNAMVASEKSLLEMTLKAAVIYDDFDFAARAAALLERAAIHTDEAMQWDIKPWRLDLLKPSALADAALDETIDVDLIVVAASRTHLLPDELLEWLEHWAVRRRIADAALLVLCPEETAGPTSLGDRLKEFAEWRGLPFLDCRNLRDDEDPRDFVHRRWQQKQPVIPAAQWPTDQLRATRHWGINE